MLLRFEYMQHRFRPSRQEEREVPQDFSQWRFAELRLFITHGLRGIGRILQAHPLKRPSDTAAASAVCAHVPAALVAEVAKRLVSLPVFTASAALQRAQGAASETVMHTVKTLAADAVVVEPDCAPDPLRAQTKIPWLSDILLTGSQSKGGRSA